MSILLEAIVRVTQVVPCASILWLDAQRIPVGMDRVIVFLERSIGDAQLVPRISILGLIAYRFPIGMNGLVVLFKVGGSKPYVKPGRRVGRITLDFLLREL